ncbi:MAG: PIG-L deacetylase family protein [Methylococcales bacterium]
MVDSFPWQAASKLRAWREEVLAQGLRKLKILVIGAHPDDIELGCGGTILELRKRNHEVHALIVTDGCGGEERSPITREKEANDAAKVLGLRTVEFGRIRDGQTQLGDTLFNLVMTQIVRHKPDLVICHANVASEHSDHKNVSETVKTICGRRTTKLKALMFEVPSYCADRSFTPRLYVNIDSSIETKQEAVNQHISEIARGTISLDQVEKRACFRASEIGSRVSHAEAFALEPADTDISEIVKLMPFVARAQ